ncbi:hypothetical protein DRO22_02825, partial [Candidatus Bathyarchaeota archaeon]
LVLVSDNQIKSVGTGIVIKDTGILLTANHVIKDYFVLSNPKIIASSLSDIPQAEYKPIFYNFSVDIDMPGFFVKPLEIDLAILQPLQKTKGISFMELDDDIAPEGTDVIMAGFPDEIKPPLHFDETLDFNNPELAEKRLAIENFFDYLMRLIMMKSGMIGSTQRVNINTNFDMARFRKVISINGAVYWVDNSSTYGASGGPVINSAGKLIGIICEKGMTQQKPDLEVPSGSTMALSHKFITWYLDTIKP